MDMFYLGDCLRGLNMNPTLKMIDKLGGAKKKGEKFIKLEEVRLLQMILKKRTLKKPFKQITWFTVLLYDKVSIYNHQSKQKVWIKIIHFEYLPTRHDSS